MIDSRIRIPVLGANTVRMRLSPLPRTGDFSPAAWRQVLLTQDPGGIWWQIDLATLGLADGVYEYDFQIDRPGQRPVFVPDPYAEEITRFGGYRGIFRIGNQRPFRVPFDWSGELPPGVNLPNNNEMIIYELPMRWVDSSPDALQRQVGLGTFDKAIFERLSYMATLGINAIELLPIQDSPDTLNWGYGTRFFFAPDFDMGEPTDLKLFIKECHRRGIRVLLDVVMNHSKECPLETLAFDLFYLHNGNEERLPDGQPRDAWGGKPFRYRTDTNGTFYARNLHYDMAAFWINEYHIDGFRIDEFKGIDNWDFIREFRHHTWQVHQAAFSGRPFLVIAEDSWRRPEITYDHGPDTIVDAMWDFDFRDEVRRLVTNRIESTQSHPRSERVSALISGNRVWNDWDKTWRQASFSDLARRITYNTSHDVERQTEQRLVPYFRTDTFLAPFAWDLAHATFALMLTTVGIPMFLAGEEFGDLHDLPHEDWRQKMSDPVDWQRASLPGHRELYQRVQQLVQLRRNHPALQRNEVGFFGFGPFGGFHPQFNDNDGPRVFAYCRTANQRLGSNGQVIVVANCGQNDFPSFWLDWPWGNLPLQEAGSTGGQPLPVIRGLRAELVLRPFQVRVFVT